jgi:hypothetical protein
LGVARTAAYRDKKVVGVFVRFRAASTGLLLCAAVRAAARMSCILQHGTGGSQYMHRSVHKKRPARQPDMEVSHGLVSMKDDLMSFSIS